MDLSLLCYFISLIWTQMHITAIHYRPMSDAWSLLQALLSWETSGPELDDLSSVAFGDPSEISHAMPHIPTNASSRLQVPPVFQQAVCLPVPTSPGGSRPPPQFLPRDVVLLQCPLCVETPSSSSPAPAALPCRDVRPCLLSCTHPATKRLAFFGSPAELNISHLFL